MASILKFLIGALLFSVVLLNSALTSAQEDPTLPDTIETHQTLEEKVEFLSNQVKVLVSKVETLETEIQELKSTIPSIPVNPNANYSCVVRCDIQMPYTKRVVQTHYVRKSGTDGLETFVSALEGCDVMRYQVKSADVVAKSLDGTSTPNPAKNCVKQK